MASERANPRMAYEKSCCFKLGFLIRKRFRAIHTTVSKVDLTWHIQ